MRFKMATRCCWCRRLRAGLANVWGGHSCPPSVYRRDKLKRPLRFDWQSAVRGQECPRHTTTKQMRLGPATQAALFSWIFQLAVSRSKAIDDRDHCTRESTSARDTHLRLAPTGFARSALPSCLGRRISEEAAIAPGSSALDMNRNSPGDSPSRESPATLNRTDKVQNITRVFD